MKILVLAPHPFYQARGTPIAVRTVLEFLSARGDTVDVLTYPEGANVDIPNCTVHRVPHLPGLRNIRAGFSAKKLVCDGMMVVACARLVRRNRYDLIHAVEESVFIANAMRAISDVPYVYDMDSSLAEQLVESRPIFGIAMPLLKRLEGLAVRRSIGVLAVCAALEEIARGHAPNQFVGLVEDTTLLSGETPPEGDESARLPVFGKGPIAMYVGNLEPYQGIDLLLEGFVHTLTRVPEAKLVIVGGRAPDIAAYRARAEQLGVAPAVSFIGPRPLASLDGLLRQADVVVSPRLKGLNTPMKIYSYLDSGAAVLATRLRTHTQVLDDRISLLVEPAPGPLGEGLARLLADRELRAGLAARAKEYVQREHTPEAARRKLTAFYDEAERRIRQVVA